jgi:hypothetical protein
MSSKIGNIDTRELGIDRALYPRHNVESTTPGLPVKAAEKIYGGCMVAYDPANSQAQSADPAMPATAKVIGVLMDREVDNTAGAKGALKVTPKAGIFRIKHDGNLTAAHIYKTVRVVDDHTVGVPDGTDADRPAGLCIGLDADEDYAWVLISAEAAQRGPVTVTLTSTNGTAAAAADLAALKAEAEKIGDDVRAIHAALSLAGIVAIAD